MRRCRKCGEPITERNECLDPTLCDLCYINAHIRRKISEGKIILDKEGYVVAVLRDEEE